MLYTVQNSWSSLPIYRPWLWGGIQNSPALQPVVENSKNPSRPDPARRVVATPDDYGVVKVVDATQSERMIMMRDACKIVVDELKADKPVFAYVMGPLSTLSLMRGQRKIRRDFSRHGDDIRAAVENITETLEQFAGMLLDAGVEGIMWDTYFAGSSNMTRDQWRSIEFGSMARLAEDVRSKGGINMVHSCQSGAYFDLQIEAIQPSAISFFHPAFGCDSMVASAAPKTPIPKLPTNSRSSATFSAQETIRKYSGVRESPSARCMEEA